MNYLIIFFAYLLLIVLPSYLLIKRLDVKSRTTNNKIIQSSFPDFKPEPVWTIQDCVGSMLVCLFFGPIAILVVICLTIEDLSHADFWNKPSKF